MKTILQFIGAVYVLFILLVAIGLLIAAVKTWIQIAFNAVRRCARENKKGKETI